MVAGSLAGALAAAAVLTVGAPRSEPAATTAVTAQSLSTSSGTLDVGAVVALAGPSVVSIESDVTQQFGRFAVEGVSAGTGVIIAAEGLVLTNAHVVDGASALRVTLGDGTELAAELVGASTAHDVALIRLVDPPELTPAVLGSSADLQVGDEVIAIGNALGLDGAPSVTKGIVSAKGRSLTAQDGTVLDDLIQTDAAINSGNSGGPLLDTHGRVVGINTAIIADTENLGFAIAIDTVKPVVDEILARS